MMSNVSLLFLWKHLPQYHIHIFYFIFVKYQPRQLDLDFFLSLFFLAALKMGWEGRKGWEADHMLQSSLREHKGAITSIDEM